MTKAQTKTRKTTEKGTRATKPAATAPATAPVTAQTSYLKPPRQTKAALLRARLGEPGGASMATLMEMTVWQAHTLRAALTGLRNGGLTITRRREGDDTIYAIEAAATQPMADGGDNGGAANGAADGALAALAPEPAA